MIIRELDITHFGKFQEQKVQFHSGINIIYGNNESGKSTIHAFIRAMLYGLDRPRGRSRLSEYERRQPWSNPAWFCGSMILEQDGKLYRIHRDFAGSGSLELYCETEGRQSREPEKELQTLLGGMSENVFVNTLFIPQEGASVQDVLAEEMRQYMLNIRETGDADLDIAEAQNSLKQQLRKLEVEKQNRKKELDEKIERKKLELESAINELERVKKHFLEKEGERSSGEFLNDENVLQEQAENGYVGSAEYDDDISEEVEREPGENSEDPLTDAGYEETEERKTSSRIRHLAIAAGCLMMLNAVLCGLCGYRSDDSTVRIGMGILSLLFALLSLLPAASIFLSGQKTYGSRYFEGEEQAEYDRTEKNLIENEKESDQEREKQHLHARLMEEEIRERQTVISAKQEELDQLYREHDTLQNSDGDAEAIRLASERIRDISQQICRRVGTGLDASLSEILSSLTDGKYTTVMLDEQLNVRIRSDGLLLAPEQVSFAAMNQIYFALRMAAGEMLAPPDMPVILDDAFAMYDSRRLEAVLRWLDTSSRQIILLTGHTREKAFLDRIGKEMSKNNQ